MANLIENKKANMDYEITEKFEAGIELLGTEVKSIKAKQGSLLGAKVIFRGGEAYLVGASIPAFQEKNALKSYDKERTRKLLLKKEEILSLGNIPKGSNLTIIPISCYNKGDKIKLSIGLARHKKKYDKREDLKKKDDKRSMARVEKNFNK